MFFPQRNGKRDEMREKLLNWRFWRLVQGKDWVWLAWKIQAHSHGNLNLVEYLRGVGCCPEDPNIPSSCRRSRRRQVGLPVANSEAWMKLLNCLPLIKEKHFLKKKKFRVCKIWKLKLENVKENTTVFKKKKKNGGVQSVDKQSGLRMP